jgi:hypothetical protein
MDSSSQTFASSKSKRWSRRFLFVVGFFCVVLGSLMLAVVILKKPWVKTPRIVANRIRLPITSVEREEEPMTPDVVEEMGMEDKPAEGSVPEEEKPFLPESPEPSMMIPEKGPDEKVVMIGRTELPKPGKITQIVVDKEEKVIRVTLIGDRKIGDYNCFKLKKPPRLVVDIWNAQKEYPKSLIQVDHPLLKRVRLEKHPKKIRFVFESALPQVPLFRVQRAENRLVVSFGQVYPP